MENSEAKGNNEKLEVWQKRLANSNSSFSTEVTRMDQRERLYNGDHTLRPLTEKDVKSGGGTKQTSHVRNIVFENIESQVSSSIPQPKVTPKRREDEHLAEIIERFLRNELDRLPFEEINDLAERTVPIQGGVAFLVEWDNTRRSHNTVGELAVSLVHPKQLGPQPGVYTGIRDMDWIIVKVPTTKEAVRRKYGVSVDRESESEAAVRSVDGADVAEEAVTQYIGYERSDQGGINRYVWVNDIELEDLDDYQARRQPVCKRCGRVRPLPGQIIANAEALPDVNDAEAKDAADREAGMRLASWLAERYAEEQGGALANLPVEPGEPPEPKRYDGGRCPWCGSEDWETEAQEYEQVMVPVKTGSGLLIPGLHAAVHDDGPAVMEPTLVPYYKPDVYPIVLQRSVSVYGQFLGNSDVDIISDQQNTINRLSQKIIDRIIKAGTRITLPAKANLRNDPEDGERWFLERPDEKAMIGVYDFSGNLQYELTYLAQAYEEARQELGITDSFQGRKDATATSGKAKEFSAAQAAGRLDSKRVMKKAAYANLFEIMFKFWLAYSDEPRTVTYKNSEGQTVYDRFDRYDFLMRDESGEYWWNDQFLFSCEDGAPLAANREALWQENRMNLQTGAFGDPASTDTLILFWKKMEEDHYPGASDTLKHLEERKQAERAAQGMPGANAQEALAGIPGGALSR